MLQTSYNIEESIIIKSSTKKVWENILYFKNQFVWSPWLILDKKCNTTIEGNDGEVGSYYTWEGNIVGSGEMENIEIKKNESIQRQLRFITPFKSTADVHFEISKTKNKGEIKVIWKMTAHLPFFLFWMKNMMKKLVSKDFKRGLNMLKILSESGKLPISTEAKGVSKVKSFYWIGIERTKPLSKLPQTMQKDFSSLFEILDKKELNAKKFLAFYPKVDMKNEIFTFISAAEISEKEYNAINLPAKFSKGVYEATDAFKVVHKGSYNFLEGSWSALYMGAKGENLKINKSLAPMEVYVKNCKDGFKDEELVTDLYLPVK